MTAAERILNALRKQPGHAGMDVNELADAVPLKRRIIYQVTGRLRKEGVLKARKNEAGWLVYTLAKPTYIVEEPTAAPEPDRMTYAEFARILAFLDISFEDAFKIVADDDPGVQETLSRVCQRILLSMKQTLEKRGSVK